MTKALTVIITSSVLILTVIVLRTALSGRINPKLQYALWLLVALRLLIPFEIGAASWSVSSLIGGLAGSRAAAVAAPDADTNVIGGADAPTSIIVSNGILGGNSGGTGNIPGGDGYPGPVKPGPLSFGEIVFCVWLSGALTVFAVQLAANLKLAHELKKRAVPYPSGGEELRTGAKTVDRCRPVYLAERLPSPCLFGVLRPKIYLNCEAEGAALRYILAHEMTHYRHRDHWWALLRMLCLCVHWFNPLVWWAASLSRRDCELACDADVLRRADKDERIAYGQTLLGLIARQRQSVLHLATTMTGDKGTMIERFKMIANKPRMLWITLVAVVLIAAAAAGCAFAGAKEEENKDQESALVTEDPADTAEGRVVTYEDVRSNPGDFVFSGRTAEGATYVEWVADLTHDGADETVVVAIPGDMTGGQSAEVWVYSASGDLLWEASAAIPHAGWNGVYLYSDGTDDYLMLFSPSEGTGLYSWSYSVFYLKEDGSEADFVKSSSLDFTWDDIQTRPDKLKPEIAAFGAEANGYLSESFCLLDTDGGELAYSTPDNKIVRTFDVDAKLRDMGLEVPVSALPSTGNLPRGYEADAVDDGTLYSRQGDSLETVGYIGWIDAPTGWLVITPGISLGSGDAYVYLTGDGGATWNEIGNANGVHRMMVTGAGFASEQVGFLSYRYYSDAGPDIWRTTDGGGTWTRLEITLPQDYRDDNYRFTPLSPRFNGSEGVYPILVYKWRDDGNYDQETINMVSQDGGLTWAFEEGGSGTADYSAYPAIDSITVDDADRGMLVRYGGVLYARSDAVIDFALEPGAEGLGRIEYYVGADRVPQKDFETNSQSLISYTIWTADASSMVCAHTVGEYVLFVAVGQRVVYAWLSRNRQNDVAFTIMEK